MATYSFEKRLDRLHWTPSTTPSQEIVETVLGSTGTGRIAPRNVGATMMGAIFGICIGFALLGMQMPGSPWGPETGLYGVVGGSLALLGLFGAVVLAGAAVYFGRARPKLMQFASMQLLMIVVLLLA